MYIHDLFIIYFAGHILSLVRGKAGTKSAVYQVFYTNDDDSEEETCEVEHMVEDYLVGDVTLTGLIWREVIPKTCHLSTIVSEFKCSVWNWSLVSAM